MQQPEQEREVGAGYGLDVQVRCGRGRGPARVDDDERAAVVPQGGEVCEDRRHRLGEVAAEQDDDPGAGDVGERQREAAVHPERTGRAGGGAAHAEAAVVVDLRAAQRDPGELAERVGLLVGQAAATEHGDCVAAALGLGGADPRRGEVQCRVPGGGDQGAAAVPGHRPDQRPDDPVGVLEQVGRRPALLAEATEVRREHPGADLHLGCGTGSGGHLQPHPALQGAVRAVRVGDHRSGHGLRHRPARTPCRGGRSRTRSPDRRARRSRGRRGRLR